MIIIKNNKVAFEEYWLGNDEKSRVISWSMAKSMISALMGIAIEEGLIRDVYDPVTEYVPFLKGMAISGGYHKNQRVISLRSVPRASASMSIPAIIW